MTSSICNRPECVLRALKGRMSPQLRKISSSRFTCLSIRNRDCGLLGKEAI